MISILVVHGRGGLNEVYFTSVGKCDSDECSEKKPQVIAADKQHLPFANGFEEKRKGFTSMRRFNFQILDCGR